MTTDFSLKKSSIHSQTQKNYPRIFPRNPFGRNFTRSFPIKKNPGLIFTFSSRPQNMSLSYGDTACSLENRRVFLAELGVDYNDLVCAKQVHGHRVEHVQQTDRGKGALSYDTAIADTDALFTNTKYLPLAVFTADCLPVFLYDRQTCSIALIHAGWRGTKDKISARTVELMKKELNTRPKDLSVGFGPGIRDCCYEVGEEFREFFPAGLKERKKHHYLDLIGENKKQFLDIGVEGENIFDSGICTFCSNDRFFSYRKEGNSCGRMISVAMLT